MAKRRNTPAPMRPQPVRSKVCPVCHLVIAIGESTMNVAGEPAHRQCWVESERRIRALRATGQHADPTLS